MMIVSHRPDINPSGESYFYEKTAMLYVERRFCFISDFLTPYLTPMLPIF